MIDWKKIKPWWVITALVVFTAALLLIVPASRERIFLKVDEWRTRVFYQFNPPEEAVFIPKEVSAEEAASTETPVPTVTPTMTLTIDPEIATATPEAQVEPTATPTPLPDSVYLDGVKYMDQHGLWNYCAPTNLAMALSYWGVNATRLEVGTYLKPFDEDRNVKPYEMIDYVANETDLSIAVRTGGTPEVLKRLLAAGYPVVIEKGLYMPENLRGGKVVWMGHYNIVVGYDEAEQVFITHDSYLSPPDYPLDYKIPYAEFQEQWRGFNYIFLVVYPPEDAAIVYELLGAYGDSTWADEKAAEIARDEIESLEDEQLFFAWFNLGTSLSELYDYNAAAEAFDQAFSIYAEIEDPLRRPFRMMWYQTGPYFAYYYTARYQDVIDLATTTIEATNKPYFEESWYWRGQARWALGDVEGAVSDFRQSLIYHPDFSPSVIALESLGVYETD